MRHCFFEICIIFSEKHQLQFVKSIFVTERKESLELFHEFVKILDEIINRTLKEEYEFLYSLRRLKKGLDSLFEKI